MLFPLPNYPQLVAPLAIALRLCNSIKEIALDYDEQINVFLYNEKLTEKKFSVSFLILYLTALYNPSKV